MKYFVSVALLVANAMAYALEVTRGDLLALSWKAPETRENGAPLGPQEIGRYTIAWQCDTGQEGAREFPGTQTQITISTAQIWGDCQFVINTTDTDGLASRWSDPAPVLIKLPKPAAGGFR